MQEERIGWDDPWLASGFGYHNVNPDRGLFLGLEAEGKAWRMTSEQDVESALLVGPTDTRAGIRGLCIRRFSEQIKLMQWERIQFSGGLLPRTLEMGDLFEPQAVQVWRDIERCLPDDGLNDGTEKRSPDHELHLNAGTPKGPAIRCLRHRARLMRAEAETPEIGRLIKIFASSACARSIGNKLACIGKTERGGRSVEAWSARPRKDSERL
jgi:hypothetical protein